MQKQENKQRLLSLAMVLKEANEKDYWLTATDIISILSSNSGERYDYPTIQSDIKKLQQVGLMVETENSGSLQYRLASKDLSLVRIERLIEMADKNAAVKELNHLADMICLGDLETKAEENIRKRGMIAANNNENQERLYRIISDIIAAKEKMPVEYRISATSFRRFVLQPYYLIHAAKDTYVIGYANDYASIAVIPIQYISSVSGLEETDENSERRNT